MKFEPGKNKDGRVPTLGDGKPVFSVCGPYYISRSTNARGIVCDAWVRREGEAYATNLAAAVTAQAALAACKGHRDGIDPQVS